MNSVTKEQITVGNIDQISDYFKEVVPYAISNNNSNKFEIPTLSIKSQLEKINDKKNELRMGIIFYFIKIILEGKPSVQLCYEPIWIRDSPHDDTYFHEKINTIFSTNKNKTEESK
jgi:hypothetical protein